VKTRKLIHALLILALCYGQLVASVHQVGHLHVSECEGNSRSATDGCSIAHHTGAGLDHTEHSHPNNAYLHATHLGTSHQFDQTNGQSKAENNCAIYHALLNLDVTVQADPTKSSDPSVAKSTNYVAIQFTHEAPGTRHIRAPPQHS